MQVVISSGYIFELNQTLLVMTSKIFNFSFWSFRRLYFSRIWETTSADFNTSLISEIKLQTAGLMRFFFQEYISALLSHFFFQLSVILWTLALVYKSWIVSINRAHFPSVTHFWLLLGRSLLFLKMPNRQLQTLHELASLYRAWFHLRHGL